MTTPTPKNYEWPDLLQRHGQITTNAEYRPRRVRKRFHMMDVTMWQGVVHIDDIQGYSDNVRLRFFLNRWRSKQPLTTRQPTSDEIYEIMIEGDREEVSDSKKPFHVARIADNIARNGIQEPLIIFVDGEGPAELWDGNRRYYGSKHIMRDNAFTKYREQAQWLPVYVVAPSGDPAIDQQIKHSILTECNFVEKDHIPWPAYVKAEEIHRKYTRRVESDPSDPALARKVKGDLAREYGLKTWSQADRWIKMYDLAAQFKEYHEEEHNRPGEDVDLVIQEKFEYFDELSKASVWGCLKDDPDARDEVFRWLWDGKFKAFPDVRQVPKILADPVARRLANADDADGVKRAIATVIANDPTRIKDKEAANEKIKQFATWLDSFKRGDYKQLSLESLSELKDVLEDVVKMLDGLLNQKETDKVTS
jgi:hypothetical protein